VRQSLARPGNRRPSGAARERSIGTGTRPVRVAPPPRASPLGGSSRPGCCRGRVWWFWGRRAVVLPPSSTTSVGSGTRASTGARPLNAESGLSSRSGALESLRIFASIAESARFRRPPSVSGTFAGNVCGKRHEDFILGFPGPPCARACRGIRRLARPTDQIGWPYAVPAGGASANRLHWSHDR
jgi:hypothetical protein